MPYAFAHPAAAIPLARVLGSRAVPSALVIGSMVPDLWYFLPFLGRADTHGASGLLLCLPAAWLAYAAFHLVFKQPLVALLPRAAQARLQPWTGGGLPRVPWTALLVSLALGIATHLAWDALTHPGALSRRFAFLGAVLFTLGGEAVRLHQLLQHGSTLLGGLYVGWWSWRKLHSLPAAQAPARTLSPRARFGVMACFVASAGAAFSMVLLAMAPLELDAWRDAARAAGLSAFSALGIAALAYCLAWRRV